MNKAKYLDFSDHIDYYMNLPQEQLVSSYALKEILSEIMKGYYKHLIIDESYGLYLVERHSDGKHIFINKTRAQMKVIKKSKLRVTYE